MPDNRNVRTEDEKRTDANRDPITGAPGAHPVGTGVGAAAGGAAGVAAGMAAGAAMGTAGAGPIGGAVGAAVGAVAGGMAGKGVAEQVNPTEEDAYWREQHQNEPYYDSNYSYDDYRGAYRTGYEGYGRLGQSHRSYTEAEPELRRDYERNYGASALSWDKAQPAVRAAWQRFDRNLERFIGYDVVDQDDNNIGTLECLWTDHTGEPAFIGVRTGWFMGKTHVVPAHSVEVSQSGSRLRLPYMSDEVKNAPAYDADSEMNEVKEDEVYRYYGITQRSSQGQSAMSSTELGGANASALDTTRRERTWSESEGATARDLQGTRTNTEDATIALSEEQLKIGKRDVEAGGVRLRKIVRTEIVNQPVELRREEVVIERVPASEGRTAQSAEFGEKEIYIPLRREEAVVEKQARVREEVRARKQSQTDTQQVTEQIRKEDVEIERTGEAKDTTRSPRSRKS